MEFWGVEVKPGQASKINPGESKMLHLSQASLGEVKKDKAAENVLIHVKFGNEKLVLGTLSADKYPQIQYDLVFEKEFELSHSSKSTSIFFCGYKSVTPEDDGFDQLSDGSESESDEEAPVALPINKKETGKPAAKNEEPKVVNASKEKASTSKPKPKQEALAKAGKSKVEEEEDEDDDDDDESEEDDSDEEMAEGESDSGDEDEDESSDDEDETPVKAKGSGDKRPLGSASKTPVQSKKAKLVSPLGQKTGGSNKKHEHIATPHPAKKSVKTPSNDKTTQQSPKSAGSVNCKSCSKSFNSDNALQAHTKAKHVPK